jgi:hypothetical protein
MLEACILWRRSGLNPDSPDEMAFGQLRAPISDTKSNSYAGLGGRVLTDPTDERRNRRFRQRFRGLRSCRLNSSGESGLKALKTKYWSDFKIAKLHKLATLLAYRHPIKIAYLGAFNHRLKQGLPLAALSPRNAKLLNESRSSDRDKRSQASYWASLDA